MAPLSQTLLRWSSSSLLILSLIHFSQTCNAASSYCIPSACGIIRNISSPFRLNDDPNHCGDRRLELACESNVTFLYLNSHKYYVRDINYDNSSMRVVDASINNNDTCSFPTVSAYRYNFSIFQFHGYYSAPKSDRPFPINFMSCPNPLKNTSLFTDITHDCASNSNFNSNSSSHPSRFTYVKVGYMKASELPYTCGVDVIVMSSWKFKDLNNVSLSEIHESLLYGFQIRFCGGCTAFPSQWEKYRDLFLGYLPVLAVVLVLLVAGLCFPLMIIAGLGFLSFFVFELFLSKQSRIDKLILGIAGFIITAPRFIICPFAVWFLIYKFRKRHLSIYEAIECFLQGDNKLTPIRYSYSDIKKMTLNFKDKLGQGGYGSVYKGKLRSGHHVAVKLLGKSGANGQDFINEIATIGRIHHVNVVKLVGYCAQGSKRALVFDFMPNSSLEKYLFNREKLNFLNWDMKFEIAIGVARGIEYLHRGCDVRILHFDIKPHNILLDENFIPKISDFGLAKLCSVEKDTVTLTAARGTIGYVAPELISRSIGAVSYKADVYSFGMLLVEMVGLKRDLIGNHDDSSKYFPYWIYDCFNQGKDIEIGNADENEENDSMRVLVRKMTIVALWCIQMNPDDRPSMNKVLKMLEADVERLQIPKYPFQSTQIVVVDVDESEGTAGSTHSSSLLHQNCVEALRQ